jgi:hypothetical protein
LTASAEIGGPEPLELALDAAELALDADEELAPPPVPPVAPLLLLVVALLVVPPP